MTEFLVKHFVKDYEHVEKVSVRTAYGVLASIVGIFCNVFLFVVKFAVGLVAHSVSVMADAFNNLSDAGSSIISFVGDTGGSNISRRWSCRLSFWKWDLHFLKILSERSGRRRRSISG